MFLACCRPEQIETINKLVLLCEKRGSKKETFEVATRLWKRLAKKKKKIATQHRQFLVVYFHSFRSVPKLFIANFYTHSVQIYESVAVVITPCVLKPKMLRLCIPTRWTRLGTSAQHLSPWASNEWEVRCPIEEEPCDKVFCIFCQSYSSQFRVWLIRS